MYLKALHIYMYMYTKNRLVDGYETNNSNGSIHMPVDVCNSYWS